MSDNEKLVHELTMLYLHSPQFASLSPKAFAQKYYEVKATIKEECGKHQEYRES